MLARFRNLVDTQRDNHRAWRAEVRKIRHSMTILAKWIRHVCRTEDSPRWQVDDLEEYRKNHEWYRRHRRRVHFKWIQAIEIRRNRLYPVVTFDSVLTYRWLEGEDLSLSVWLEGEALSLSATTPSPAPTERITPSPAPAEPRSPRLDPVVSDTDSAYVNAVLFTQDSDAASLEREESSASVEY